VRLIPESGHRAQAASDSAGRGRAGAVRPTILAGTERSGETHGQTVNAIYRLGEHLTVRLPPHPGGAEAIAMEARLLPQLAPLLPLPIPEVVTTGAPGEGYPLPWAVHRWIEGRNPVEGGLAEPELVARDLARPRTGANR
jgi:aminoglycoside phosphotransferase (APT) family kinase protein